MSASVEQVSLYEAEAAGVLRRAHGHARALGAALDEAAGSLAMTDRRDLQRQLDKLRELERMVAVRVESMAKRVEEGSPA